MKCVIAVLLMSIPEGKEAGTGPNGSVTADGRGIAGLDYAGRRGVKSNKQLHPRTLF